MQMKQVILNDATYRTRVLSGLESVTQSIHIKMISVSIVHDTL